MEYAFFSHCTESSTRLGVAESKPHARHALPALFQNLRISSMFDESVIAALLTLAAIASAKGGKEKQR